MDRSRRGWGPASEKSAWKMGRRTRTVRQRHGTEEFTRQCRAMMSQSGADIARGEASGRRSGHEEGRREREASLGESAMEEKEGGWRR